MAVILVASMQALGHIDQLLNVAEGLVTRGDRVTVLTSSRHADRIRAVGATPAALPPEAEFDEADLDAEFPGRSKTSGVRRLNFDFVNTVLGPMPHQTAALTALMQSTRYDAILADAGFFGIVPFLLGDPAARPPVLSYSTTPLMVSSCDHAPTGLGMLPSATTLGRVRNRALNVLSQRVLLRASQRAANQHLRGLNSPALPVFVSDAGVLADRYIAPTVPMFDYPRSDLPANVRFVGAVHPRLTVGFRRPGWWSALSGDKPVVHVTQSAIDNADLGRLVEPTIEAFADEDAIVVATTGGRPVDQMKIPLPANTFVAEHIPYEILLPHVDVMVTNGNYCAVQRALSAGVPLVMGGDTEDKPEVAARVEWTGAGVNLRTGTPSVGQIRRAVLAVLGDARYLHRARELESAYARRDGVAEIAALVDEVIAERARLTPQADHANLGRADTKSPPS
ncbi:nucleotide disphospho-sugar-binding domain-containing protein [Mycolicibacterium mengxianglii]|uniref:nucleotide disphospho-sugar-binding domain-containing protein n=1 Tax=Mycolicibacterium mengxianglii TaxID=2736649 RepID=UPI0018CFF65E|nr:nucleotide disphospho-sugar-binding domain-containing protein [Mycolicibacterium mengxianglii]